MLTHSQRLKYKHTHTHAENIVYVCDMTQFGATPDDNDDDELDGESCTTTTSHDPRKANRLT
jgi:hypothetical protein